MKDYKTKYVELRNKFISTIDVTFRQGYEKGYNDAMMEAQQAQMQQQMQQQAMMEQQAMAQQQAMMGQEGQQGEELDPAMEQAMMEQQAMGGQQPVDQSMQMQQPNQPQEEIPTELDSYIAELESMVAKGEKPSVVDLRKKINEIADFSKKHKESKLIYKKAEPTIQKKIVDEIISKWKTEAEKMEDDLEKIIMKQGIEK